MSDATPPPDRWPEFLASLPAKTKEPQDCGHALFASRVDVTRLLDSGKFIAEVMVACVECHEKFRFLGPEAGLNWRCPTVSIDGTTLHAPIEPEIETRLMETARYEMPPIPTRH